MRKALTRSAILMCLFFFQVPLSFGQDTKKETPKTDESVMDEDRDDEGHMIPSEEDKQARRPVFKAARVGLGLEIGPNVNLLQMGTQRSDIGIGGTAGAFADIRMAGRFYVQPGIFYVMNGGANVTIPAINPHGLDTRINTVEIPVTVVYKAGSRSGNCRFTVGLGGYVGYNAGADINGVRLAIGNAAVNDDLKLIDAGVGVNVGLELRNGMFFRIKSQRGLVDLQPNNSGNSIYTESHALTIGYLFTKKARTHHRHMRSRDDEYINRM